MRRLTRDQIAARAAQDLHPGMYVNLGVGIPTLVASHIPSDCEIMLQSENGILGIGPPPAAAAVDGSLVNANEKPITLVPGASVFSHVDAFVMIRGGHLDLALLGAFQVSRNGDIANWSTNQPAAIPAVGGAMDLAVGAKAVWVLMEHVTKDGQPRIVDQCSYPLTGRGVVRRIYTDLAVLEIERGEIVVREMVSGLQLSELQAMTDAPLRQHAECQALSLGRLHVDH